MIITGPLDIVKLLIHLPKDKLLDVLTKINNNLYKVNEVENSINTETPTSSINSNTNIADDSPCPECGCTFWIRTGTCKTCTNCSYAGGCG